MLLGAEEFGSVITMGGLVANLVVVWLVFARATWILDRIGNEAAAALGKIFSLLLAAIGVMLIRQGLKNMIVLY